MSYRDRRKSDVTLLAADFLSREVQAALWRNYITADHLVPPVDDHYEQRERLITECLNIQMGRFARELPDECAWFPYGADILGPPGTVLPDDDYLREKMIEAADHVKAQFDEVRKLVLTRWL